MTTTIFVDVPTGYGSVPTYIKTPIPLSSEELQTVRDRLGKVTKIAGDGCMVGVSFVTTADPVDVTARVLGKIIELLGVSGRDVDIALSPSCRDQKKGNIKLAAIIAQMKSGQAEAGDHSFYDGKVCRRGDEWVTFVRHAD